MSIESLDRFILILMLVALFIIISTMTAAAIVKGLLFMAPGRENIHNVVVQPQKKPSEQRKPSSRIQRLKNWLQTKLGIKKEELHIGIEKDEPQLGIAKEESKLASSSTSIIEPSSAVLKLPTEVLTKIMEHLPASSATSFTFSCKQTYRRLGSTYSSILMEDSGEIFAYLNLLARDLPDQIACQMCGRLHKITSAHWYASQPCGPHSLYEDCKRYEHGYDVKRNLGDEFNILVFQMAMKQYKLGLNCDQLLRVISSNGTVTEKNPWGHVIRKRTDCTIFQGFMIQRVQSAFINMTWKTVRESELGLSFDLCSHFSLESSKKSLCVFSKPYISQKCLWKRDWYRHTTGQKTLRKDDLAGSGLRRCTYCWTEFRIDLDYSPDYGLVVACTRWKNFGKEPHVSDPVWKEHLGDEITQSQLGDHSRVLRSSSLILEPQGSGPLSSAPLSVAFDNDDEEMLVRRNHRNDILDMQLKSKGRYEAQKYRDMLKMLKPNAYCPE
jgi:hypothetical protein